MLVPDVRGDAPAQATDTPRPAGLAAGTPTRPPDAAMAALFAADGPALLCVEQDPELL